MMEREAILEEHVLLGRAAVAVPGSCGELVQGMVGETFFHITCPVNLYSTVSLELYSGRSFVDGPPHCPKTVRAVQRALAYLGQGGVGARLEVDSQLPRAKGMASSTADIVAAVEATACALGRDLSAEEVASIALAVEPSDGTMFPGIAAFDHRHGRLARVMGSPPPVDILVLDFGGTVDTLHFNSVDRRPILRHIEPQIREALELARQGIHRGDPALVGRAATISALANQEILNKPQLEAVIAIAVADGAVGVNVAHSGTVIGVLLDAREPTAAVAQSLLAGIARTIPGLESHYLLKLVGGGARLRDVAVSHGAGHVTQPFGESNRSM